MSLASREADFKAITDRFPHEKFGTLAATHKIPADLFRNLQTAVAILFSRIMPEKKLFLEEKELLEKILEHRDAIPNITPTGLVVPKRYLNIEYNLVVKSFVDILKTLNIGDFVKAWSAVINVTYKDGDGERIGSERARPFATDNWHADSWAGDYADGVNLSIPIFGDTDNNYVRFKSPPLDFQEEWMSPALNSYKDKLDIVEKCKPLDMPYRKGDLIAIDLSVVHATTRNPGCKARVALITYFATRKPKPEELGRISNMTYRDLCDIGESKLLVSPDRYEDWVQSSKKQIPANLQLVPIPFKEKVGS